jgi:hypothetical protein
MSGSQIVATGFPRQIVAKVLSSEVQTLSKSEANKSGAAALVAVSVYFISSADLCSAGCPHLVRIDDMEHGLVRKYCAMLRSSRRRRWFSPDCKKRWTGLHWIFADGGGGTQFR